MHNTTDTNKSDKMGERARTVSRTSQESAHTAMDYALRAQEMNTEIMRRTSRAWIEGFRYQARLSQGMAQMFFGQWGAAFKSMPRVDLPGQEQSGPEVIEPATNGAQKATGPAAKDVQKDVEKVAKEKQKAEKVAREKKATEVAAKDAQKKAEKQKAEKQKAEKQKADKVAKAEKVAKEKQRAEKQRAEKVARETRKAEEAAEKTQEATETAAKSAQKSAVPAAKETQESTEVAAKDAQETQKSTEIAAKDAQKNTETGAFPVDGYDEMNVGEVSGRLDGLSANELKRVRKYEKDNKDRGTLRKEINQKIKITS